MKYGVRMRCGVSKMNGQKTLGLTIELLRTTGALEMNVVLMMSGQKT